MRILIARDEAFNFTYRANIDALRQLGEVAFFSPLHDEALPPCDLLYLPGGYPELYLDDLSLASGLRQQIYDYAQAGGRILAECGGFMYLCRDIDGRAMCGIFPFSATMENARLHLGYRQQGDMRGHEFHYSHLRQEHPMINRYKNVIAGYTHWYWAEKGFETLWNTLCNAQQ